jgi:hypothetical protein
LKNLHGLKAAFPITIRPDVKPKRQHLLFLIRVTIAGGGLHPACGQEGAPIHAVNSDTIPGKPGHPNQEVASKQAFLDNNSLRIGVDLSSGGAIFWLSESPGGPNLLNHADRGRFIQQSYYGKPDGSKWVEKPWRWNPVQGGDYKGRAARLLETNETADTLHVKSVPVNWAGGEDIENCQMEQWITLDGKIAHLKFRFSYQGTDSHPAAHQELPAVFVDHKLGELIIYQGERPWTGGALTTVQPGWPNEYRSAPENWAAFVGVDGRGVGVLFPGTDRITTYRFNGPDGPEGGGCSYFAPIRTMAITPGLVFEYVVHLSIGTAAELRERFALVARKPAEMQRDAATQ